MELYGTAAGVALLVVLLAFGGAALRRRRRTRPPGRPARRPSARASSSRPSSSRPSPSRPGGGGGSRSAPPGRLPEPREIWWARVPFDDGVGGKDRPCLVLYRGAGTATVLKITSKHHTDLAGVIPLPPGTVGDRAHRASWLETEESREVPFADFRRRVGAVDPQLWTRVRRTRAR